MKRINLDKLLFAVVVGSFLLLSCSKKDEVATSLKLDYSESELWFELSESNEYSTDIFYILPTCIWDWSDEDGTIQHYADPYNTEQREAMQPSYELAADIFASQANFFAPYYQQISLNSWMEGDSVVEARFPLAMSDIESAFDYFIEHHNQGRPFVLAGFSQGGKGVVELLKVMPDSLYSRMVAAYVIGYRVSNDEINSYSSIEAATSATDTGVTVSYNSVENEDGISEVLSPSDICINPINWRTDSVVATIDDTINVSVDLATHTLFVEGIDSESCYIPELEPLLPKGNYHLQELTLYQESLTQNVVDRIAAFAQAN